MDGFDKDLIEWPEFPEPLKDEMSTAETLNGFTMKFVAVESIIFVVDQFRQIRGIIDQLTDDDEARIEDFFSQVCAFLRFGCCQKSL